MSGWGEITEGLGCGTRLLLIVMVIAACLFAIPFLIAIAAIIVFILPFILFFL